MQKVSRQVLAELLWLTISFGLTILLAIFFFGQTFLTGTLDIHLHDTYFVIAPLQVLLPMFFMVTFIIYFIKEFRNAFGRTLSNCILILTGLMLAVALNVLNITFLEAFTVGWTSYPPLTALGPEKIPEQTQEQAAKFISIFFAVLQISILIILFFVTYRWGTQNKKATKSKI